MLVRPCSPKIWDCGDAIHLHVLLAAAIEIDVGAGVVIDGMRMGVLSQPVAAMLAQGLPLEQAFIPVGNYARNVFTVLFMGVGTIVGAVLTHDFHIIGKLEIAVAAQYLLMVHCEMAVGFVFIGQCDFPIAVTAQIISSHQGRAVGIASVVDDDIPVVTPHLMADPV